MEHLCLIIFSYIADLVFGDPEWFPHPVRGMGRLINVLDYRLNNKKDLMWIGRIKGLIAALLVIGISGGIAYLLIKFLGKLNSFLGILSGIYLGYTTLSVRDLFAKAKAIHDKLITNSLAEARLKLSKIVGRDTETLTEEEIIKAAIESIAESTNDGIVAPLFYLILGGPALAIAYKAINTLDSMIGYRNEKYVHFGWFSAKLDDAANFFPARITGCLIVISSFVLRRNFKHSLRIMIRDGRKHPSPNSGISEAAMAGALELQLGGPSTYGREIENKPTIGEDKMITQPQLINEAIAISFMTSLLMVVSGVLIKWAI